MRGLFTAEKRGLFARNIHSGVSTDLINPNSSTTQIYSYPTSSYKGFQFSKILSSFNLSVWF
jgi:hypothetical protein